MRHAYRNWLIRFARLTLGTYTDPRLLDTASALDALPSTARKPESEQQRATGTYDTASGALGVSLGGKMRPSMQNGSRACARGRRDSDAARKAQPVERIRVSTDVQRNSTKRANGLEPSTFSLEG